MTFAVVGTTSLACLGSGLLCLGVVVIGPNALVVVHNRSSEPVCDLRLESAWTSTEARLDAGEQTSFVVHFAGDDGSTETRLSYRPCDASERQSGDLSRSYPVEGDRVDFVIHDSRSAPAIEGSR